MSIRTATLNGVATIEIARPEKKNAITGAMYKQFAVTIAISVILSGIVALTLTPALCALILKPGHHEPVLPFRIFNRAFDRLTRGYTAGVAFFIIASGETKVSSKGVNLATLGPGEHFGEVALIDGEPRSATVTAATDLVCYSLTFWEIRPLVDRNGTIGWCSCKRSRSSCPTL